MRRACFCCCKLRKGVMAVIIITLVWTGYNIYICAAFYSDLLERKVHFSQYGINDAVFKSLKLFYLLELIFVGITLVVTFLLVLPIYSNVRNDCIRHKKFLLPWVMWEVVTTVKSFAMCIFITVKHKNVQLLPLFMSVFLSIPLLLWGVAVVVSYYQYLGLQHLRYNSRLQRMPDEPSNSNAPSSTAHTEDVLL